MPASKSKGKKHLKPQTPSRPRGLRSFFQQADEDPLSGRPQQQHTSPPSCLPPASWTAPMMRSAAMASGNEDSPIPSPNLSTAILTDDEPELRPPRMEADPDLRAHLLSLPSRTEMEAMTARLEHNIRADMHALQQKITIIEGRISGVEANQTSVESRVKALELMCATHGQQLQAMHLRAEDMENRSRRNNLRIRGIPESVPSKELHATVTNIFNKILGKDQSEPLELDRVHRVTRGRIQMADRPRDVLCRVHFYIEKEEILRRAWQNGKTACEGYEVHILPDISSKTLYMRRLVKPLLNLALEAGIQYRWGYPFAIHLRRGAQSFCLKTHAQLPALFDCFDLRPIEVPDWLSFLGAAIPAEALSSQDPLRKQHPTAQRPRSSMAVSSASPPDDRTRNSVT